MAHTYKAVGTVNTTQQLVFEGDTLPSITKPIRKLVKLEHGNIIRTALIEEGIYHVYGYGRKKTNQGCRYDLYIFVERTGNKVAIPGGLVHV